MERRAFEIPIEREAVFAMDPEDLAWKLKDCIIFNENINSLETREQMFAATEELNMTTAYMCYLREMETIARLKKRKARANGNTADSTRLLGIEEVFESFRRIAEQHYECIAKVMTAKRLMLDEARYMSSQT